MENKINAAGKGYGLFSTAKGIYDKFKNAGSIPEGDTSSYKLFEEKENINPKTLKNTFDIYNNINPMHKERGEDNRQKQLQDIEVKKWEKWYKPEPNKPTETKNQPKQNEKRKIYTNPKDFYKDLMTNNNPNEDITLKTNDKITQQEIDRARKNAWFESKDKETNRKINNKISSWHDDIYGTQSSKDATGRTINPSPKTSLKTEPYPLKTRDGYLINQGFEKVSNTIALNEKGANHLQNTLNTYAYDPKLKEDGNIGPKTTSRLKETLVQYGLNEVIKKLA